MVRLVGRFKASSGYRANRAMTGEGTYILKFIGKYVRASAILSWVCMFRACVTAD